MNRLEAINSVKNNELLINRMLAKINPWQESFYIPPSKKELLVVLRGNLIPSIKMSEIKMMQKLLKEYGISISFVDIEIYANHVNLNFKIK